MLKSLSPASDRQGQQADLPGWRFWLPLALQLAIVLVIPAPKVLAYTTGVPVVLRTLPVDPLDFLRGRYVSLQYELADPETFKRLPGWKKEFETGDTTLYWTLAPGKQGEAWHPVAIGASRPSAVLAGNVILQGQFDGNTVHFGLEEYYLPENAGSRLQSALAGHRLGNLADVKVDAWGHAVLAGFRVGVERF
jgi:uncharacterized membrane-anchored protein